MVYTGLRELGQQGGEPEEAADREARGLLDRVGRRGQATGGSW